MAITRARKEELVSIYSDVLQHTSGFVITEYRGLSVAKVNDLRSRLREVDGAYLVTKNTLFSIALKNNDWPVPEEMLLGPVATAFADGNLTGLIKSVLGFEKDNPDIFVVKGGVMGGNVLTPKELQRLSELPSLDELRAQLAGLIVQPATGLVSVLNAATASVVNVLEAYVYENSTDDSEAA